MPDAHSSGKNRIVIAAAVVAAAGGFLAGSAGPPTALADGRPRHAQPILPTSFVPPAVAVERGGFAVVGAADGLYYVVAADGTSCAVTAGRSNRDLLYWR